MTATLPLPPHVDPDRAGQVWRVPYLDLAPAAEAWAREHRIDAASDGPFRTSLVLIDLQVTGQ